MSSSMSDPNDKHQNRLGEESSPYLLQHAENPVDWYPWGPEALSIARRDDRPIFLSIGYSACHWCHVMEHESFENEQIAASMNRYFVNIKVDREERPDLDQIYMNSVVALSGRGGWPMSVFLTPELKPFFGGTYWPPASRMGLPGFGDVIEQVHKAWQTRRDDVLEGANQLTDAVIKMGSPHSQAAPLSESLLEQATAQLLHSADRNYGGFGNAPKFPHSMDIRLLLRSWKRFDNADALWVATRTLERMSRGGIYDHLGGGFHRYATDSKWLVPHFEKMLYDNALLVSAYLEAYQATNNADYARVVRETLDYVQREMTHPDGGFYSTQDADSEGVEGKFFVWSAEEIAEHLGKEQAEIFNGCYDVTPSGNWEGTNILNRVQTDAQAAQSHRLDEAELARRLAGCRETLVEVRRNRIAPGRDEKILTSWNGLMIAAMAQAAQVLGEETYQHASRRAADFVLEQMQSEGGRLLHAYKNGRARFNAYLDDYACLIDGLVDAFQATCETRFLDRALELAEQMIAHFRDRDSGGFFYTSDDHETMIARNVDSQDNATPSGNSMAATALLRLGRITGQDKFLRTGEETLERLSGQLKNFPVAAGQALVALDFLLGPTYEIAVVDGDRPGETGQVLSNIHRRFLPNKVVLRKGDDRSAGSVAPPLKSLLDGKSAVDGNVTTYVCQHGTCQPPVVGIDPLQAALDAL
jgi:hypothetical protein